MVRHRLTNGRWAKVAGRGLALPSLRWTPFQLAMAAGLTLPKAVISHWTAAALHGFPVPTSAVPTEAQVIVGIQRRTVWGIRSHLLRLGVDDVETGPAGLRITSPRRTALDCMAGCRFDLALNLWAWVSTRAVMDRQELSTAIRTRDRWHGTPQLRRIHDLTQRGALSGAEYCCHELLTRAGLTGWTANLPIEDDAGIIAVGDIVFASKRLVIEIDGFRAHSSPTAFVNDRRRQNRLIAAGYIVLRFTWDDLRDRPGAVIAEIRSALHRPHVG